MRPLTSHNARLERNLAAPEDVDRQLVEVRAALADAEAAASRTRPTTQVLRDMALVAVLLRGIARRVNAPAQRGRTK
jgi:hypothetical protein